jgi:hypothetical protein
LLKRLTTVRRRQDRHRRPAAKRDLPDLARRPVAEPLVIGRKERIESPLGSPAPSMPVISNAPIRVPSERDTAWHYT